MMGKMHKGQSAVLNGGILNGLAVEVLRQSPKTGVYTVRVTQPIESAPAYKVGTELHVSRYELREAEPIDMQDETDPAGRIAAAIETVRGA